jgi:hypothetical protein
MNLSIPDAAAELGVSETRLRKTLAESVVPTQIELRKTRTGIRKTTILSAEAIALLRAHFEAPLPAVANVFEPLASPDCLLEKALQPEEEPEALVVFSSEHSNEAVTYAAVLHAFPAEAAEAPHAPFIAGQTVPLAQFHALLYQHNVLREELTRVSEYLEGCDRLLGEMVRTIATLEERTRQLEPTTAAARRFGNPLAGALRSVSTSVQNALLARNASARPMLKAG